jgi:hypothetical protein
MMNASLGRLQDNYFLTRLAFIHADDPPMNELDYH